MGDAFVSRRLDGGRVEHARVCPHRGAPLDRAAVVGERLVCPWHGSEFDLATGAATAGPACIPLRIRRPGQDPGDVRDRDGGSDRDGTGGSR